jgi:hypothetical protein
MAEPASVTIPVDWRAKNLKELRKIWDDLHPESDDVEVERFFRNVLLTPTQAGDVFERWVIEAFRLSGMVGHTAFRVPLRTSANTQEQIDGLIFDGWQAFLVEAKFWTPGVDFSPIVVFNDIVDSRPAGTLGLFFSAFGYTGPAKDCAELLRPIRVLLFDRDDLNWALQQEPFKGSMKEMVRRKWLHAVMSGRIAKPVSAPFELF